MFRRWSIVVEALRTVNIGIEKFMQRTGLKIRVEHLLRYLELLEVHVHEYELR